jgi:hypothetical protein
MKINTIYILVLAIIVLFLMWFFVSGGDYNVTDLHAMDPHYVHQSVCPIQESDKGKIEGQSKNICKNEDKSDDKNKADKADKADNIDDTSVHNEPFITGYESVDIEYTECKKESKGEKECRRALNEIFRKDFIRSRPKWLRNPKTGYPMELDCYNKELGIAVEYNGIQHYKWPNFTNQSKQEFIDQVERSKLKPGLCDKNDVYLISVPYTVPNSQIKDYIVNKLVTSI